MAVRLQKGLVAAIVERAPDVLETGVHCAWHCRVHQLGPVKLDRFAALSEWSADDDPLGWITVLEVYVCGTQEELIKADCWVPNVETGLAAIAVDDLRPLNSRAVSLKRSIVLRPAL